MYKLTLSCFFVFLFSSVGFAQEIRLQKGNVTDNIKISDSTDATYAVYLPQSYDMERPSPVIFILDPNGQAREAVQLFRQVAEDQNYVIAASNQKIVGDSIEQDIMESVKFMNGFFRTIKVDPNLLYIAGINKGAEIASAIPLINERVSGILAINKAWINRKFIENREKPYILSLVSGTRDYSRFGMIDVLDILNGEDYPTEINYFEGGPESWPDTFTISNAVGKFTLEAMNNGERQKNDTVVNTIYQNEIKAIESLVRQGSYYTAFTQVKKAEEKFDDFERFDDQLKDLRKEIRKTREFKQQRRKWFDIKEEETFQKEDYDHFLEVDIFTNNFENIGWWAEQLDNLKEGKENKNLIERNRAYRLEGYLIDLVSINYKTTIASKASIDSKIFISILKTIVDKNDPDAYLSIVKLAGHDGDAETAMLYLEDLLKTGYKDFNKLYEIEGILDLQMSTEFNLLIEEYGGEAKYIIFDSERETEEAEATKVN
ncbi:hypothetical protein [Zunongwangia atlantica]|uniref:Alpha/beta hydrolase n=1 Tax=Zunongwangia atlantica 22II14-10F7 TaxID=1185767 RepID=A0A1Y1T071_9FLAO|nr:hypothetical protein [Zunongwangia atlantica]ORL44416.1 hypothetical protein IIF7_15575 [Zunongwangia atlantica 22II14-10F7]